MGRNKIKSKEVEYDGYTFDSKLERDYYKQLVSDDTVASFQVQPAYTLLDSYRIPCVKCRGQGKTPSPRTGKLIQCRSCKGTATSKRPAMTYMADFLVQYKDGYEEVVDCKGFANERFPVKKKLFEWRTGQRLVVVTRKNGEWVKK